ncbi:MAG TPA: hypothetical protein VFW87_19795 [Pirellulales bacterium]|nr:hypothetical protein [Pirellulales bacterium]
MSSTSASVMAALFGALDRGMRPAAPDPWHFLSVTVTWLMPLMIALLGGGLLLWHWQCWRAACAADDGRAELGYQRRRFRRRMQTSGMLMLIGAAMVGGQAISPARHPSWFVSVWAGVAVLAVWAMALAAADLLATRAHVGRLLRRQFAEQAKLQAELARKKAETVAEAPPADGPGE